MPLIRICDHFKNNPKRIDKLISIKGLPEEWFFRETPEGKELKRPWQPDVDANIPYEIRNLCEPMYLIFRYAPIERGAKELIEKRQVLGFKIDYNTEPGREMWDQVERFIEESTPRNERIPVPVLCAKDEHSVFETYHPRRNARGSLELVPSPVPSIDLVAYLTSVVLPPVAVQVPPSPPEVVAPPAVVAPQSPAAPPQAANFACDVCQQEFVYQKAFKKHQKLHVKERAVA